MPGNEPTSFSLQTERCWPDLPFRRPSPSIAQPFSPKFLNWSFGLEQKIPGSIYLRADFIERRGSQGFVYANQSNSSFRGDFVLQNTRKERYDAITLTARRVFSGGHVILASYTRSRAHSNEVLDFNVDQPIFFEHQAPGPLA